MTIAYYNLKNTIIVPETHKETGTHIHTAYEVGHVCRINCIDRIKYLNSSYNSNY